MNKTAVALALIVCIAAVATVVVYVVKSRQPAQVEDEFSSIEDQLNELDNFLGFEDQTFDYDLSELAGDWG